MDSEYSFIILIFSTYHPLFIILWAKPDQRRIILKYEFIMHNGSICYDICANVDGAIQSLGLYN